MTCGVKSIFIRIEEVSWTNDNDGECGSFHYDCDAIVCMTAQLTVRLAG